MPKIFRGGRPFSPKICAESDPPPFVAQRFRSISAHSASTVIAKKVQLSSIGSRPLAFQRAIDEPCTLPLSPQRLIAGDVPIYLKLAFKVTHPFRKRRFPKLSFKSAIGPLSGLVFHRTIPWPSIDSHRKFYGDPPRGTPPSGDLNARG